MTNFIQRFKPAVATIALPYPPSVNGLYANASKGRRKVPAYNRWIKQAGWELEIQRPQAIQGTYSITVSVGRPDKRKRDISNVYKAVSDLLVRHGVVQDDHLEQEVHLKWDDITGCMVTIEECERLA